MHGEHLWGWTPNCARGGVLSVLTEDCTVSRHFAIHRVLILRCYLPEMSLEVHKEKYSKFSWYLHLLLQKNQKCLWLIILCFILLFPLLIYRRHTLGPITMCLQIVINAHVSKQDEFILNLLFGVCCLSQFLSLTTSQTVLSITANSKNTFRP